jgi:hypothetical protein
MKVTLMFYDAARGWITTTFQRVRRVSITDDDEDWARSLNVLTLNLCRATFS